MINEIIDTEQRYVCVSRPRRFGKSMAANMLSAYYSRGIDSDELFCGLAVGRNADYKEHLNKYDVIRINIQEFLGFSDNIDVMLASIVSNIVLDLKEEYVYVRLRNGQSLVQSMKDVYACTGCPFVILIDEWDCIFREYKTDKDSQKKYLDFLRSWLKDQDFVALAYMTGILPIKKYGTHSSLNMFTEYSMTSSRDLSAYFGFTEDEVRGLCSKYGSSFEEMQAWYDGYELTVTSNGNANTCSIYNPKSVVDAVLTGIFDTYWNQTETYEALRIYPYEL